MILFFDTETTGFAQRHKPIVHEDQPHIVQLAALLCDPGGAVISGFNFILDPGVERGVRIPGQAAAIHGIDEEKAWRFGQEPQPVLKLFDDFYQRADLIVGHNIDFDVEMIQIQMARHRMPVDAGYGDGRPRFCTMKQSTDICRLPSPRGGFKWPKLSEAYKHFFNEELEGAHDAMNDVMACKRVFFHLRGLQHGH